MWPDHKNRPATSVKTRVLVPAPNQESGSCTGTWDNRGTPAASRRESTVHVKLQPKEPASGERPEPVGLSVPHGACGCQGPDTSTPTPGPSRSWKHPAFGPGPNPQVTGASRRPPRMRKAAAPPAVQGCPLALREEAGKPHARLRPAGLTAGPAPVRTSSAFPPVLPPTQGEALPWPPAREPCPPT